MNGLIEKLSKLLTRLVLRYYEKTPKDSLVSKVNTLRAYLDIFEIDKIIPTISSVEITQQIETQFDDITDLYKCLVKVRASLQTDGPINQNYSNLGKTKKVLKTFMTTSNGYYIQPKEYLLNIKHEIGLILSLTDTLGTKEKTPTDHQNLYLLTFLVNDLTDYVLYLVRLTNSR